MTQNGGRGKHYRHDWIHCTHHARMTFDAHSPDMSSAPGAAAAAVAAGAAAAAVASPAVDSGGSSTGRVSRAHGARSERVYRFPPQHEGREGGNSHAADAKQSGPELDNNRARGAERNSSGGLRVYEEGSVGLNHSSSLTQTHATLEKNIIKW